MLNHVALSLPADRLDRDHRRAIATFYRDVFAWREVPMMTVDRERLVLSTTGFDQFVYLVADEQPLTAPRMDHFGVSVGSLAELEGVYERARAWQERDPRVDLVAPAVEDHKVVKIHNIYVGFLLPLAIEVQYWDMAGARA